MNDNLYKDLPDLSSEKIIKLENRISQLETELDVLRANSKEMYERVLELEYKLPNSLLLSPRFLIRAFTVLGHNFVANLFVALPIICISIAVVLLLASFGSFSQ